MSRGACAGKRCGPRWHTCYEHSCWSRCNSLQDEALLANSSSMRALQNAPSVNVDEELLLEATARNVKPGPIPFPC